MTCHVTLTNSVDKLDFLHRSCIEHFRESNCIDIKDIIASDKGLHISLSRQFTLRHHHISAFIRKLGEELQSVFRNRYVLVPIKIRFLWHKFDRLSRFEFMFFHSCLSCRSNRGNSLLKSNVNVLI